MSTKRQEDVPLYADEGSYLASVSDLMSGLLFIFVIALMIFGLSLREQEVRKRQEVQQLQGAEQARRELLAQIKADLEAQNIQVEIDPDNGVLRLGEAILFESGQDTLGAEGRQTVPRLAQVLVRILPCYTGVEAARPAECGERARAGSVDAIFIEGHTDSLPLSGLNRLRDNWDLSTSRARTVFLALTSATPTLGGLQNRKGQPIFSLSGYADQRRVVPNDSDVHRRKNRRIDLRFVMTPPLDILPRPARETQEGLGGRP